MGKRNDDQELQAGGEAPGRAKHALGRITASAVGGMGAPALLTGGVATFATAGTGTAISTLSGAAATKATLAAIGGSVATGSIIVFGVGVVGAWGARRLYKRFVQKA